MPKQDLVKFNELSAEVTALVAPVKQIKVTGFESAQEAITAGNSIKELIKKVEKTRKELVKPLNDQVDEINAYAKQIQEPLKSSEEHLKRELVSFEVEQEKIRQAELKRLEAEKAAKLAEIEARAKEEQEVAEMFGTEAPAPEVLKVEQAVAVAQHKEAAYDISNARVKNTRKTWKCEVTDISKVPDQFLIKTLNEAAILAMARASNTPIEIPGVRIYQETGIAFGSKTYVPRAALEGAK